jgi:hypothetical protein
VKQGQEGGEQGAESRESETLINELIATALIERILKL